MKRSQLGPRIPSSLYTGDYTNLVVQTTVSFLLPLWVIRLSPTCLLYSAGLQQVFGEDQCCWHCTETQCCYVSNQQLKELVLRTCPELPSLSPSKPCLLVQGLLAKAEHDLGEATLIPQFSGLFISVHEGAGGGQESSGHSPGRGLELGSAL